MAKRTTKRRTNGKAKPTAEPLKVSTYVLVVPPWKSPCEALEYLEHDVANWLTAASDLTDSGVHLESMLLADLARIVEGIAAYLREPRPVETYNETFEYLDALTRMIRELDAATDGGLEFKDQSGLGGQLAETTQPLLGVALARAVESYREETAHRQGQAEAHG